VAGTAMISRLSTSSLNVPPSISVAVMREFSNAISVSACTTSGQLWHDSEKYISKW
jgi:hypothetical protein